MRLLDKKAIASTAATQKKSQIDEGVMIAEKIDKLRETLSSLEAQRAQFLASSHKELEAILAPLHEEIGQAKRDLETLREERASLLKPLDEAWESVRLEQGFLEGEKESLRVKRETLTLYAQELADREKKIVNDEERITDVQNSLKKQVEEIAKTSLVTQDLLLKAREVETSTLARLEEKRKEVHDFGFGLLLKEKELAIRENHITLEEQNIIKEKAQLKDQRATLERAFKRL